MSETARPDATRAPNEDAQAGRAAVPLLTAVAALALTIGGALLTGDPTSGVNRAVEGASSASSTFFGGLGRLLLMGSISPIRGLRHR